VYALEAVVRADGTRPSLLVRNNVVDPVQPQAVGWTGQLTAACDELTRAVAVIGRVEPTHPSGSDFFGTCWVLNHRNVLVLTNRDVLVAMVERLSHAVARMSTGFWVSTRLRPLRRRVRQRGLAPLPGRRGNPVPGHRHQLRPARRRGAAQSNRCRTVRTTSGRAHRQRRPRRAARPPRLVLHRRIPGPAGVRVRLHRGVAWVTRTLFGDVYGVKRLAPGMTHRPLGSLAGDKRRWVFGHDATTLGGCSGSAALAWTDSAFGLHFAGRSIDANYAYAVLGHHHRAPRPRRPDRRARMTHPTGRR
jgi:hypothetical protein